MVCSRDDDGGHIIEQMNEHAVREDDLDAVQMIGVFIVSDPDCHLTKELLKWFEIPDSGNARAKTTTDLT